MTATRIQKHVRDAFLVFAFALLAGFFYVFFETDGRPDARALFLLIGSGVSLEVAALAYDAKKNWSTMIGIAVGVAFAVWAYLQ